MAAIADFELVKELAFGGISGSWATVGAVTTTQVRAFCITNMTAGDMSFSIKPVGSEVVQMVVAAGSFKLYDVQANISPVDDKFVLPVGTQFSVQQITAPVSKSVYIECLY